MAEINVRDIRVSDKEEFLGMVEGLFNSNATVTDYNEEIAILNFNNALSGSSAIRCLIFEYKEIILGYAYISFSYSTSMASKCLWLEDLYIKEEARRKGVGEYFINWLCNEYKKKVNTIHLEVTKDNFGARRFYESLKFKNSLYMQMCLDLV